MRILLHSNAPWVPTGYGQQTGLFAKGFRDLGHEVAVSAFYGLSGTSLEWDGIPIFPAGARPDRYGLDMLPYFAEKWRADWSIVLADAWVGAGHVEELSKLRVASWLPIDAEPLSRRDFQVLVASGSRPIAMSRFGERMLQDAHLRPLYGPHGVDTGTFVPYDDPADRNALREEMGVGPDTFVVGMNAANRDLTRKGFFEQFSAFARFHERVPDSRLYVHTVVDHPNGLDLISMAKDLGINDDLWIPDQGAMVAGEIDAAALVRNFYHLIDLYSGCSIAEGFGIPILEAQACGVPVVVTDGSAMTELCAPDGWLVRGEPLWVEGHRSRWVKPYIGDIAQAYDSAWSMWQRHDGGWEGLCRDAREHALQWDIGRVLTEHWKPVLEELAANG